MVEGHHVHLQDLLLVIMRKDLVGYDGGSRQSLGEGVREGGDCGSEGREGDSRDACRWTPEQEDQEEAACHVELHVRRQEPRVQQTHGVRFGEVVEESEVREPVAPTRVRRRLDSEWPEGTGARERQQDRQANRDGVRRPDAPDAMDHKVQEVESACARCQSLPRRVHQQHATRVV